MQKLIRRRIVSNKKKNWFLEMTKRHAFNLWTSQWNWNSWFFLIVRFMVYFYSNWTACAHFLFFSFLHPSNRLEWMQEILHDVFFFLFTLNRNLLVLVAQCRSICHVVECKSNVVPIIATVMFSIKKRSLRTKKALWQPAFLLRFFSSFY